MSAEILPENKCDPQPGDLVEIQWEPGHTRRGIFVRKIRGHGRSAIVRMERTQQGALGVHHPVAGEYGKDRGIDAWAILRIVTPGLVKIEPATTLGRGRK